MGNGCRSQSPSPQVCGKARGPDFPTEGLTLDRALFLHFLKEKASRGHLVIVLWSGEPSWQGWTSSAASGSSIRNKRWEARWEGEKQRKSVCGFEKDKKQKRKKKREKSSCFSFPREKNYLTWHKIYLRGIFLEWLRKNTRCFLAAGKCILNRIHMGPSMIMMFGEEPDSK